ncbi:MAG: glycosyltransferase [Verrucomicrobiota bacterium]
MSKTMRAFCGVLDGQIVSFTSKNASTSEKSAFPEVFHVDTSSNKLLGWFGWASSWQRSGAEALTKDVNLITCHMMLRYHSHWARSVAKKEDIPYWVIPHGQLDPWVYTYRAGVKQLWLRLFGRRILQTAQYVIFATESERKKASWFYEGANTRVVHWPVELIDVSKKDDCRLGLRRDLGVSEDSRILLFFGRLHSMKRPLETIELLSKTNDSKLHLVVVGPDGDISAERCRKEAQALGVGSRVHVLGPVFGEKKNQYLLGADAFISLSHRENFGHTAAEALAAATPVILSPGNDLGPELASRSCGWLLESNDLEDALSAIEDLTRSDQNDLRGKGNRGRDFIAEECSPDRFRRALLEMKNSQA